MSKYEIPYLTASIQAFAQRFSMTRQRSDICTSIKDWHSLSNSSMWNTCSRWMRLLMTCSSSAKRMEGHWHKTNAETV